jgi:hypothetical protein
MRNTYLILLVTVFVTTSAVAQSDTSYIYYDKNWKASGKDTAFYYGKIYKENSLWKKEDHWVKTNVLQMVGTYLERECKTEQGTFKWNREDGTLRNTADYENGQRTRLEYYYETGKKKGLLTYDQGVEKQVVWDENGNEMPGYVIEREAKFPGGVEGWRKYLESTLDGDVAARSKAPVGIYTVKVQFIVDKEGNIANVQAIEVPSVCKKCGNEAVRIIKNGPKWVPAVQDNKPVIYQAIQHISWQVVED